MAGRGPRGAHLRRGAAPRRRRAGRLLRTGTDRRRQRDPDLRPAPVRARGCSTTAGRAPPPCWCCSAARRCREAVWDRLRDTDGRLGYNLYGPTEYTINTLGGGTEDSATPTVGSRSGTPAATSWTPGCGRCPTASPASCTSPGAGLARGYLDRPGLTAGAVRRRPVPCPAAGCTAPATWCADAADGQPRLPRPHRRPGEDPRLPRRTRRGGERGRRTSTRDAGGGRSNTTSRTGGGRDIDELVASPGAKSSAGRSRKSSSGTSSRSSDSTSRAKSGSPAQVSRTKVARRSCSSSSAASTISFARRWRSASRLSARPLESHAAATASRRATRGGWWPPRARARPPPRAR